MRETSSPTSSQAGWKRAWLESTPAVYAGALSIRELQAQPGTRSKLGKPSGIWWKGCLSIVKIAICGPP